MLATPVARVLGHASPWLPTTWCSPTRRTRWRTPSSSRSLDLLVAHEWLATGAVLVVERSARSVEPAWPDGLVRERAKEYGETVLWYVRAGSAGGTDAG